MSHQVAFALKAGYDLDSVGSVFVNNQTEVNVRAELGDEDGVLVTADADTIRVLDGYEQLKRVQLPNDPPAPVEDPDELDGLTKEQLLKLPDAEHIDGASGMRVGELRVAIRAHRKQED